MTTIADTNTRSELPEGVLVDSLALSDVVGTSGVQILQLRGQRRKSCLTCSLVYPKSLAVLQSSCVDQSLQPIP